ncbi:MAG TPA: helix-turn-helix domain-containing protein [Solirubrobacterales bacterium]|nr:helix-turn-helix domain-containing protein [Solirubrobacterales bacterium]
MPALGTAGFIDLQEKLRILLLAHSEEIEEAVAARIRDNDLDIPINPETRANLGPGSIQSVSMMIEGVEEGFDWSPVLPTEIAAFIRYLAREEVPLEAVLRLCSLVGAVFVEALLTRLGEGESKIALAYMSGWGLRNFDQLLKVFSSEYRDELDRLNDSPTRDVRLRTGRLLKSGSADSNGLDYRMDACHVGLIVVGRRGALTCRYLAEQLGCDLLLAPDAEDTVWAWLGARRQIEVAEIERALEEDVASLAVAVGEPREGSHGWRLTHLEAQSALPVAHLEGPGLVRYSSVALLASALCDVATGRSLIERYLKPLERYRDAEDLRRTLRVYFELHCNAVSTASSLAVNRHTVQRRLKRVEEAIGEPAAARQTEFQVVLRLEDLTARSREKALV